MSITKKKPQPAVGSARHASSAQNTGSQASVASSRSFPAEGQAVADTPPARTRAGGRDDLPLLSIDQDGTVTIGDAADPARLLFTRAQVEAIGDFLKLTEPLWRP